MREVSNPGVIKSFLGCIFLLNLVLVIGKWSSNRVEKVSQKVSKLEFTSWSCKTFCQVMLRRAFLKFCILSKERFLEFLSSRGDFACLLVLGKDKQFIK
jgi:hypothetical protein